MLQRYNQARWKQGFQFWLETLWSIYFAGLEFINYPPGYTRITFVYASRFSEKYLRLAFLNELLALFSNYVCGKYVVVAINSVRSII